ncbi:MAG: hypothetical protein M5R40_00960 [Anaerolineae bacterium]|nr:hypothetical protein [Anaerolineae bacterium]
MHQHIDWIIDPSTIPADIIIALGSNASGKLIFGMATYTSSEWRLGGRNPDSVPGAHRARAEREAHRCG